MKRLLLIVVAIAAGALAFLYIRQTRRAAVEQAQANAASQQIASAHSDAEQQAAQLRREQARLAEVNAQLNEKLRAAKEREQSLKTNAATASKHGPSPMAAMMRDPSMRDTMKRQGQDGARRAAKQLLTTNLMQRLALDETQAAALTNLVLKKSSLGFDFMFSMMTGELDEAGLAAQGRKTREEMNAADAGVRALLGDERYQTFESAEKSQPERDRVRNFSARLAESGTPLPVDAQEQLVAVLFEERQKFSFTVDYNDPLKFDYEHLREYFSDERIDAFFAESEQLNERILARVQSLLTPEQAEVLRGALRDQVQKGRFTAKSTNAMLGQRAAR